MNVSKNEYLQMRGKKERREPDDMRKNPNNMNIKCLSNEQMRVIMIEKSVVTLLSFWNYQTLYRLTEIQFHFLREIS